MTQPLPTPLSPVTLLSNSVYEKLKLSATILIPAVNALYFALAAIWGLPFADQINGTLTAANVFIGAVVLLAKMVHERSGAKYDGTFVLEPDDDEGSRLRLSQVDVAALESKDEIIFKMIRR